jgi:hypothetical protein
LSFTTTGNTTYYMNCVAAQVTGCPEAQDIGFTYGYLNPAGIAPGITASGVQGVIVYFDGSAGTDPSAEQEEYDMLYYYFTQGYEIVQVQWNTAWEAVWNPWPYSSSPMGNIQNAACRPASFLSYVDTAAASYGLFQAVSANNANAGMCAQGFSAGSAQVAYSLAYYGAASYLDNVELISGPVFSDIMQGCQEGPVASQVNVCPLDANGNPPYGCRLGSPPYPSWSIYPIYVPGQNSEVRGWTDDSSCALAGSTSSPASLTAWLNQSIVDQSTGQANQGAIPTFTYAATGMSAWLCRSVYNPQNYNCTTAYHYQYCPNNTSPQGQIFYHNITSLNSPPAYNVYAVDQCVNPEGAPQGTVAALSQGGQQSIQQDMAGFQGLAPGACTHRMR